MQKLHCLNSEEEDFDKIKKRSLHSQLANVSGQMDSIMFNLNHNFLCPDDQKYFNFYENEDNQEFDQMSKSIKVVQNNISVFCKVAVHQTVRMKKTVKLIIKFHQNQKGDFQVFVSSKCNEPSEKQFEVKFNNP